MQVTVVDYRKLRAAVFGNYPFISKVELCVELCVANCNYSYFRLNFPTQICFLLASLEGPFQIFRLQKLFTVQKRTVEASSRLL